MKVSMAQAVGWIVWYLLTEVCAVWVFAAWSLRQAARGGGPRPPWAVRVFHELRPLFVPTAVAALVLAILLRTGRWPSGLAVLEFLVQTALWRLLKDVDDDDGRWRRRREAIAGRVARLGSRLVVQPAGGDR